MPCKGMMPECLDILGCGLNAGLPAQVVVQTPKLIWISAIYRAIADLHEGLSIKPDLGPPITI